MEQINIFDLAKKAFNELKPQCDDLVVSISKIERKEASFFNSKISKISVRHNYSANAFISKSKKIVVVDVPIAEKDRKLIFSKLKYLLQVTQPKDDYYGISEGAFPKGNLDNYDKGFDDYRIDEAADEALSYADRKVKKVSGIFQLSKVHNVLVTSNGAELESTTTNYYFSLRSVADKNHSGHSAVTGAFVKKLNIKKAVEESVDVATLTTKTGNIAPGRYDVVFSPLSFSSFADAFGGAASISAVENGFSFLKGKLNKKVCYENLSIIDDPLLKDGFNFTKYDAEGTKTYRKHIISSGVVKNFLYNYSFAKKYKTKNTANAGLISPHPFNLVVDIKPKMDVDEMIKSMKSGLWVTNNWYMRFNNYLTGSFSTVTKDSVFYIENGEVKFAVNGSVRISESMLNIFSNIKGASKQSIQARWWDTDTPVVAPFVFVKKVNITKPEYASGTNTQ